MIEPTAAMFDVATPQPQEAPEPEPTGPQFGDRVTFTRHLTRMRRDSRGATDGYSRRWVAEQWPGQPESPRQGIVIGRRTLTNGSVTYNYEEPTTYQPKEHFTAYLIATDLRTNPVYVLPEHIEVQA